MAAMPGCEVARHEVNRGKGAALKTGYALIAERFPACSGVITADADGQHTVADVWRLAEALTRGERKLYLGSRDFSLPHVPKKSRYGNWITSGVFRLFYGQWLPDTQTGLRAFRREELELMRQVEGERYEYEMRVLIACARAGIPMESITIETVYENNNEGSHFHPLRDSYRIYKVILGSFVKFMGTSILCVAIDQGLAWLLRDVLLLNLGIDHNGLIWASGLLARLVLGMQLSAEQVPGVQAAGQCPDGGVAVRAAVRGGDLREQPVRAAAQRRGHGGRRGEDHLRYGAVFPELQRAEPLGIP